MSNAENRMNIAILEEFERITGLSYVPKGICVCICDGEEFGAMLGILGTTKYLNFDEQWRLRGGIHAPVNELCTGNFIR